jgi:hypothetical protein
LEIGLPGSDPLGDLAESASRARTGCPYTTMKITEADVKDVVAYLRSLSK